MKRRDFLATGAAGAALLGAPAILRAQTKANVLRFVPEADVVIFDPVTSPSWQTRDYAYLVYDTLFGMDDENRPQPQMLEGASARAEGLTWTLVRRAGLKSHDNEPVRAQDVVRSIRRWGARDAFGQALLAATNDITATNDKTVIIRLKKPFPLLPNALAKTMAYPCMVMPERVAKTDPFKAITETIGSGAYKNVAGERVPGGKLVFEKFADYFPRRTGKVEQTAGPKLAHFDRIEWTVMQ